MTMELIFKHVQEPDSRQGHIVQQDQNLFIGKDRWRKVAICRTPASIVWMHIFKITLNLLVVSCQHRGIST